MFFFNGRIHNAHIVPMILRDRQYTNQVSHSSIIAGCLPIIIGLILIVIGIISEIKKTTFISIGIISFGIGFVLMTFACFYTQLNICYHNWAYGPQVAPININTSQSVRTGTIPISPFTDSFAMTQKVQSVIPLSHPTPVTLVSDVAINKVIIAPSVKIGKTVTNTNNKV